MASISPADFFGLLRGGRGSLCSQMHTRKVDFPSITRLGLRSVESEQHEKLYLVPFCLILAASNSFNISDTHSKHAIALISLDIFFNKQWELFFLPVFHVYVYIPRHLQILTDLLFQPLPLSPVHTRELAPEKDSCNRFAPGACSLISNQFDMREQNSGVKVLSRNIFFR